MKTVNLREKLSLFSDYWNPRIIGEVNECHVKAVKLKGEFVWHHHEHEDELFLVVKGSLRMKFRDHEALVREGEFVIVPRGVEHLPIADDEVHIVLIEPKNDLKYRKHHERKDGRAAPANLIVVFAAAAARI